MFCHVLAQYKQCASSPILITATAATIIAHSSSRFTGQGADALHPLCSPQRKKSTTVNHMTEIARQWALLHQFVHLGRSVPCCVTDMWILWSPYSQDILLVHSSTGMQHVLNASSKWDEMNINIQPSDKYLCNSTVYTSSNLSKNSKFIQLSALFLMQTSLNLWSTTIPAV
jgi:hypothetical protein